MTKAKKSLQLKVEGSKISNTITGAAPYSVYNTNCATPIIFLDTTSSFTREITYSPSGAGVLPHVTKVLRQLMYITLTLIRFIHIYLYSQLNKNIFSFKVSFSSVMKFIISSQNCKYTPNLLILRCYFS